MKKILTILGISLATLLVVCIVVNRNNLPFFGQEKSQVAGQSLDSKNGKSSNSNNGKLSDSKNSKNSKKDSKGGLNSAKSYSSIKAKATSKTVDIDNPEVVSSHGIFIDVDSNKIIAKRNEKDVICPASMTKILTLLVACENTSQSDMNKKITITKDMLDLVYAKGCSAVGFQEGEEVTVKDAMYGTILPSGADAALALATYVGGSPDKFVDMMNDKLKELGLSKTAHFTNCIGLYDDNHKCSMYDMSVIIRAAMQNTKCKKIMSTHTYTVSKTPQHPDGITISNWFLRRIEDKEMPGTVQCAKTGFVNESGSCAASYFVSKDKKHHYVCVTAGSTSSWRCIYDQVALYNTYATK